jgi:hypothetical protein
MISHVDKTAIGALLICFAWVLPAEGNTLSYGCFGAAPTEIDDGDPADLNPAANKIEVLGSCPAGGGPLSIGGIDGPTFTLIAETVPGISATLNLTNVQFENSNVVGGTLSDLFDIGHTFPPIAAAGAASIAELDGSYVNEALTIITDADLFLDPFVNGAAIGVIDVPGASGVVGPVAFTGDVGPVAAIVPVFSQSVTIAFSLGNQDMIQLPTSFGFVTVPEPGSVILLALCTLMFPRRRR